MSLFENVRSILYNDWDPIWGGGGALPDNEYDDYAWKLVGLLKSGKSNERLIYDTLEKLEEDVIGTSVNEEVRRQVAKKIANLRL